MNKKIIISKKGKFSKLFPESVSTKIREVAQDFGIKSTNVINSNQNKLFYNREGSSYTGITKDGNAVSFNVVSSNTVGGSGMSHKIGSEFTMPPYSYLIEIDFYTKYIMSVYKIGLDEVN